MWFILQERWYCILWLSDVELSLQQGVYLYLGYSQKDEALLKKVTKQGALEAIGAIQGLVSYHNVNSNKVSKINIPNDSAITAKFIWPYADFDLIIIICCRASVG